MFRGPTWLLEKTGFISLLKSTELTLSDPLSRVFVMRGSTKVGGDVPLSGVFSFTYLGSFSVPAVGGTPLVGCHHAAAPHGVVPIDLNYYLF